MHRRRDRTINEPQAVATIGRLRLIGKSGLVERPVQPVARSITGKHSPRAIRPVRPGAKPTTSSRALALPKFATGPPQ